MEDGKLSDQERIAMLERRDAESRRTIRVLSSMLVTSMDRIEELGAKSRRRGPYPRKDPEQVRASVSAGANKLLDSSDVADLTGLSRASALKAIKALGGAKVGNRWMVSSARLDEAISNGEHVDLGSQP